MERKTHILVIPYPVQGHINPMLQFSKRLATKGARVTLVATSTIRNSMQALQGASSVNIKIISDGSEGEETVESLIATVDRFKDVVSQSLAEYIEKLNSSKCPPKFIVYDCALPWALDVARKYGIDGAPFYTQSCAVNVVYYHFKKGTVRLPVEEPTVSLPSMPKLAINDLSSLLSNPSSYPPLLHLFLDQFSNFLEAKWIFFSSFKELELEVVNWMASQKWPIKTIGPTIPSMYLDKRLEDDKDLASLGEEQMQELTWGLKNSNCYFLWVVRETEQKKLPTNFLQETAEKGLVVSWCSQLEVLAHKAIGCFMTHCGWNSTLEALSLGVPMVAMPQWTDQPTNAKFIADVWKVGVRIKLDERGIATKEEIEFCIRAVIEDERGKEMRMNSVKWKELAKEAMDEGGSSDKNIEEFVAELARL
ncbi:hypothetical protein CMV_020883 [Castanea mollissima]|uniref:Glycosyltransferase n=1 Tax=Castanea mollissima TaxID=60419 RepID=A0A8J4QY71_9ROSI|nr:hypothetical protein CMV_020883 [Castanea mollissima]